MKYRKIHKNDYLQLLKMDNAVYPTDKPVTPDILDNWFQNNPEFGIIFGNMKQANAMCITIPLNKKGWEGLISGNLSEADLRGDYIFNHNKDTKLYLHIYHIEKTNNIENLYKHSLCSLGNLIKSLKKENPHLQVAGLSALCVTAQGINLFRNTLNFKEKDFHVTEHILRKNGQLEIYDSPNNDSLSRKLNDGYEYINRCQMLVLHQEDKSIVWDYI